MLLSNNTENVITLVNMVDKLNGIEKVRLAINLFEDLGFVPNYNVDNFIKLFQEVLLILDPNSKKLITNFAKYNNLLFISAKYMELSLLEKQKFLLKCYLIFFNMILIIMKLILKLIIN